MAYKRSAVGGDRRRLRREDLRDQHPDVVEVIAPAMDEEDGEDDLLSSIGVAMAQRRDDAVTARQSSGLEEVWTKCEEAYVGIDDANRLEFQTARWAKPISSSGPVTTGRQPPFSINNKSNVFIRLTSRYVDAAFAKLAEILLPADDKAFSFSETPVPELIEARSDKRQVHDDQNRPLFRSMMPGEAAPGGPAQGPAPASPPSMGASLPAAGAAPASQAGSAAGGPMPTGQAGAVAPDMMPAAQGGTSAPPPVPGQTPGLGPQAPQVPLTVADLADENIQIARKKAKKAEKRIYDWMVETQYRAEMRKVLFDAAKLGVGILKGPVPRLSRRMVTSKSEDGAVMVEIKESVVPASCRVDPWNIFPDPTCGECFQNGDYVFERDTLSEKQLRDLKDEPGYIGSQIDKVIAEGPNKVRARARENGEDIAASSKSMTEKYEVWYFNGYLKRGELSCVSQASGGSKDDLTEIQEKEIAPVIATMVNDSVIKAVPAPHISGKYPYHSFPWTRRAGSWAGIGVAEQLFAPQRILNASTRSMLNNAGKSAGSQIVLDQASVRPADGQWIITPDKIWYKTADSSTNAVGDAFQLFKIPNVTNELMEIVKFALQVAEESTSIPLITQGQTGPTTPETLGATQIQNSNANQLLRSIGYSFDDHITEPLVDMYYEWLLLDPDIEDDEKGDYAIDAHGSVSMVERAIQDMTIAQMGNLVVNPVYGLDPKRWARQMIMSKKLNPDDFQYTPEEQARLDSMPPPEDPRVTAAKITMQGWETEAGIKGQTDLKKVQVTAAVDLHELGMKRELALLDYANKHKITLAEVQSELAQTAMKLKVQERLNAMDNVADMHREGVRSSGGGRPQKPTATQRPPVQVPGRSGKGRSFSQAAPRGSA